MLCELCGKNLEPDDTAANEATENSQLCSACYAKVTARKREAVNLKILIQKLPLKNILYYGSRLLILILILMYAKFVDFNMRVVVLHLVLFGPSLLGLILAWAGSSVGYGVSSKFVSLILHGISCFIITLAASFGGWNDSSNSGFITLYAVGGAALILLVGCSKYFNGDTKS